ncbi:PAS domain S-box-containing protein [Pseudomonas duriflava]|uniref:histidine kinase n=1 Tax=Pseudomonas duriflava TaxID=459528 RepID=A0A562Q981_9PSED|nr:MHYT domain-containing protein [Pseudomonas duriflava]TWI52586.1 PAS domain S-box-containing protein [Pseudomonas duriflava]
MLGTYNTVLVGLSILIAITAGFTALDLASRARLASGWPRHYWLLTAATALGGGVWAMHFVGMLAFEIPEMPMHYDVYLTVTSLVVPIAVTCVSFLAVNHIHSTAGLLSSGLFMGLGIASMHYLGMAAMEMPLEISNDPLWVGVSLLIAIVASIVSLWLSRRMNQLSARIFAALAMGIAISGMHYTAMYGASFTAPMTPSLNHHNALDQITLATAIAASTLLILFLALVAAMYDRRVALMAEREAGFLRLSEARFRSLYKGTPLPLHSLDYEGRIESVSEAWLELLGYERGEIIGRPLANFMTDSSAHQFITQDWPNLFQSGEVKDLECRMVTRAGRILDVIASARLERDEHGGFLYVLGGLINVTERKQAEEALRQAQKMEAIGQLTGGVAHDFNNLLAVVMGNLELLRKRLADDPKALALIENALLGAERGATLTQRLLGFARKQELNPTTVDIPDLLRGMSQLLERSIGPTIQIGIHFPITLPKAYVDGHQLEMVLLNLVVNARDAMDNGGTINITTTEQHLDKDPTSRLNPGNYVCLSVTDTGEGMDPETISRATEPFFTTKGVGKGTGLGLSMAQGLAEQSGGQLLIKSEKGRGTTVELWFPVAQTELCAEHLSVLTPIEPTQITMPSMPLTILVVDDDPLVLKNTIAMLEDLDHTVFHAASAKAALALIKQGLQIDMVLTDQVMPGISGTQLAEIVQVERPGLSILLMSGYAEPSAIKAGSWPRLTKPFTQAALAKMIGKVKGSSHEPVVIPLPLRAIERR